VIFKVIMNKQQSSNIILEILGWIGVIFVLGSYCLLAMGIIDGNSWIYHVLVLAGSIFIAAISYKKRIFQPMVLNLCFSAFALIALMRILFF